MVNKTIFQGRFTAKPELKDVSGFSMTEFTVAWSEKYKENEQKCFLRCKAWRNQAEHICKFFDKGQECIIEGRLGTEEWEKDGQKQSKTICNVEKIHFCGTKANSDSSSKPVKGDGEFMNIPDDAAEELPFN